MTKDEIDLLQVGDQVLFKSQQELIDEFCSEIDPKDIDHIDMPHGFHRNMAVFCDKFAIIECIEFSSQGPGIRVIKLEFETIPANNSWWVFSTDMVKLVKLDPNLAGDTRLDDIERMEELL